jgi:hypothetical protein
MSAASHSSNEVDLKMADSQKKTVDAAMSGFKFILLVLMVAQNASTVLVGRYARTSAPKEELVIVNHLVLVTEVGKVRNLFLICCSTSS